MKGSTSLRPFCWLQVNFSYGSVAYRPQAAVPRWKAYTFQARQPALRENIK